MVGEGLRLADDDGGDRRDWQAWSREVALGGDYLPRSVGRASVFAVAPGIARGGDVTGRIMPRLAPHPMQLGEIAVQPSAN
jgi:hypothetical protein